MITVTTSAVKQIQNILVEQHQEGAHLRLGVQGGGCSGMEYILTIDDQIDANDLIIENEGIKVLVDRDSMPYLSGSTLDFSNDLMNSGFVFNNPNAKRSCGCGKSFCG